MIKFVFKLSRAEYRPSSLHLRRVGIGEDVRNFMLDNSTDVWMEYNHDVVRMDDEQLTLLTMKYPDYTKWVVTYDDD